MCAQGKHACKWKSKLRRKFNFFYCPKEVVPKVSDKSDEQMSMFPVNGYDCLEICAFLPFEVILWSPTVFKKMSHFVGTLIY